MGLNIKNLLTRSLSGLVYVGLIVACIFGGMIPFCCLLILFGILAVIEFHSLCDDKSNISERIIPILFDIAGVICLIFSWMIIPIFLWILFYIFRLVAELYLNNSNPVKNLSQSIMTQFYIGVPLACACWIGLNISLHFILAVFLMIWINDTGAFLVGCSFGKHRLFERISPKKSWEGFFGGLAFNLLAGWLFCIGGEYFWGMPWNVVCWIIFGAIVTIFATWGDLIESLIKRSLNVKDSGKLIPGHGGILDRIDSLLLVFPATLLYILITMGEKLNFPLSTVFPL